MVKGVVPSWFYQLVSCLCWVQMAREGPLLHIGNSPGLLHMHMTQCKQPRGGGCEGRSKDVGWGSGWKAVRLRICGTRTLRLRLRLRLWERVRWDGDREDASLLS